MRILGLNVTSSSGDLNGRAMVDPTTYEFPYLPIPEPIACEPAALTYRELGFTDFDKKRQNLWAVRIPDAYAHVDPEFMSFTYGHMKRVGDDVLWHLTRGDILFFYATLDLFPNREKWGVYVIGYFDVDHVVDTRRAPPDRIRSLPGFHGNAHLRHLNAGAVLDLLVKGLPTSRLYRHAMPLSEEGDPTRVHSNFGGTIFTVSGKAISGGRAWHRWLLCGDGSLATLLKSHDASAT